MAVEFTTKKFNLRENCEYILENEENLQDTYYNITNLNKKDIVWLVQMVGNTR